MAGPCTCRNARKVLGTFINDSSMLVSTPIISYFPTLVLTEAAILAQVSTLAQKLAFALDLPGRYSDKDL